MAKKLRNDTGKFYTRLLFWEQWADLPVPYRTAEPYFTLYKDKPGLVNLGKEYVRLRDPTGYKLVQKHFDGEYSLWTILMKTTWFLAAKQLWDQELDAVLSSEGMAAIRELLKDGLPAQQLAAAKYLANKEYKKDRSSSKGRPSNQDVAKEAREQAAIEKELADDFKRIQSVK